ncbi:MAG: hypothetical protein ABIH46_11975 [Chloroflexota bacterium]
MTEDGRAASDGSLAQPEGFDPQCSGRALLSRAQGGLVDMDFGVTV